MAKIPSRLRKPAAVRSSTSRAAPRATKARAPSRAARSADPAGTPAAYHHGDLHDTLLVAAERILERDGLPGLTLRAAAREAGVSHAAPTHHFGDIAGLLSELAAIGFRRFAAALGEAAGRATQPRERLDAMGHAYVSFAKTSPGMFTLMFRSERLDVARPVLQMAMKDASAALAGAVADHRPGTRAAAPLIEAADTVRAWALVHGFAVLLLDGRLDHILSRLPRGATVEALLQAVLGPGSGR